MADNDFNDRRAICRLFCLSTGGDSGNTRFCVPGLSQTHQSGTGRCHCIIDWDYFHQVNQGLPCIKTSQISISATTTELDRLLLYRPRRAIGLISLLISPILSNFAFVKSLTATMNFLHYLYIKADNCDTKLAGWPRLCISWPLWLSSIFFIPLKIVGSLWWIFYCSAFLIIYLFVLWIFPPKLVKKNYNKWYKEYNDKTSLWFYLYFLVLPIILLAVRVYLWTN